MNLIMWSAKLEAEVGGVPTSDFFRQFVSIRALTSPSYSSGVDFLMARAKNNNSMSTHSGKKLSYKLVLRLI